MEKDGIDSVVFSIGYCNRNHHHGGVRENIIMGKRTYRKKSKFYKYLDHSIYPFTGTFLSSWILDFNSHLLEYINSFHPDIIECSSGSPMMIKLSKKIATKINVPFVFSTHNFATDIYSTFYDNYFRTFPLSFKKFFIAPILKREINAYRKADHIICVSKMDFKNIIRFGIPMHKISVIPNGVNWNFYRNKNFMKYKGEKYKYEIGFTSDDFIVVFLGSGNYFPNDLAVKHIIDHIAPKCYLIDENIKFLILGKNREYKRQKNVIIQGETQSVVPFLMASDLAICPLVIGGGTKLKVLEYLAAGLPTITTSIGLQGINIDPRSIYIENNINKYPRTIKILKDDESQRKELSIYAVTSSYRFSWNIIRKKYSLLIKKLVDQYQDLY